MYVPARLNDEVLCVLQCMCTCVHALYCALFYWYLLCSRKAISVLFIDSKDSVFCTLCPFLSFSEKSTIHKSRPFLKHINPQQDDSGQYQKKRTLQLVNDINGQSCIDVMVYLTGNLTFMCDCAKSVLTL